MCIFQNFLAKNNLSHCCMVHLEIPIGKSALDMAQMKVFDRFHFIKIQM